MTTIFLAERTADTMTEEELETFLNAWRERLRGAPVVALVCTAVMEIPKAPDAPVGLGALSAFSPPPYCDFMPIVQQIGWVVCDTVHKARTPASPGEVN